MAALSTNKIKDIDYSFCRELDTLKDKKLYKIRLQYNSQYYKEFSFKVPERAFLFEMNEVTFDGSKDVIALFEKAKTDYEFKK